MKPPGCKLCGKAHWSYEGHSVPDVRAPQYISEMPDYVSEMAKGALGVREDTAVEVAIESYEPALEELGNKRTVRTEKAITVRKRGRPKKWASEAERLRAYRERSK